MPATLSDKGQELLRDLPPYMQDDPTTWAIVDTGARELERIEAFLEVLRTQTFAHNADDEYRLLGLWEQALEMPVEPEGITVASRQRKVMATVRRRLAGRGDAWCEMLSEALGTTSWDYIENNPYDYYLNIRVFAGTSDYTHGQVYRLLRQITPAHLSLTIDFGDGFRVSDLVGDLLI